MLDVPAVLAVLAVYAAGVVIPGPNFIAVVHCAVTESRRNALGMVAGIVLVNLAWAAAALLGVAAVFNAFPAVALAAKLVAAAYLCWVGATLIRRAGSGTGAASGGIGGDSGSGVRGGWLQAFRRGVAVNIVNPKSMAFYAATFSAAAPPQVNGGTLAAMLAVVFVVAIAWYGAVAVALSSPTVSRKLVAGRPWFERLCGAVLVALGLKQAAA
jgi:threonine efflux protein